MPGRRAPLDLATGSEALEVLEALLQRHPELDDEANAILVASLRRIKRRAIASHVVARVDAVGIEHLAACSGRRPHAYVSATEAAWEVLEAAVEAPIAEITRFTQMGLDELARRQCEGLVLGLYELDQEHQGHDVLQYAPDFPAETAGFAIEQWRRQGGRDFDRALLEDELLEWAEWIEKAR